MEFRQLEAFVAVSDRRSFSEAANDLFLSQSTISSHIKNLEQELQRQLIVRSTKPLRLTPEGEDFLLYARRIVKTRDAALLALEQSSRQTLRLAASTIPSAYLLPGILEDFQKLHSNLKITCHIHQGDSADIRDMVLDGVVDLGFLGQSFESAKCKCIPFRTDQLVLVTAATPDFRRIQRDRDNAARLLSDFPLITREKGSGTGEATRLLLEKLGVTPNTLRGEIVTNDLAALKNMVRNGLGIAICSRLSVEEWEREGKILTLDLGEHARRQFYVAYSTQRPLSPIAERLVECTLRNTTK